MAAMSRLMVFSLCVTALCRLSASTPYEKYVRFLGAILLGAQLVGLVLSMVGQDGNSVWGQIAEKSIQMEADFYGQTSGELEVRAEEIRQQLWEQSESYWSTQLQEAEAETETGEETQGETEGEILPVLIEVERIGKQEADHE